MEIMEVLIPMYAVRVNDACGKWGHKSTMPEDTKCSDREYSCLSESVSIQHHQITGLVSEAELQNLQKQHITAWNSFGDSLEVELRTLLFMNEPEKDRTGAFEERQILYLFSG